MTYCLSNKCTKNYCNRIIHVQVTVEDVVTCVFETQFNIIHCSVPLHASKETTIASQHAVTRRPVWPDQKSEVPIISSPPAACRCPACPASGRWWWCGRALEWTGPWCRDGWRRPRIWSSSATMRRTFDWAGLKDLGTPCPSPLILHTLHRKFQSEV